MMEPMMSEMANGWTRVYGPTVDATGDEFGDLCDRYGLLLLERSRTDDTSRETLIYANGDRSVRLTAEPFWDAGIGNTYSLCVDVRGEIAGEAAADSPGLTMKIARMMDMTTKPQNYDKTQARRQIKYITAE